MTQVVVGALQTRQTAGPPRGEVEAILAHLATLEQELRGEG